MEYALSSPQKKGREGKKEKGRTGNGVGRGKDKRASYGGFDVFPGVHSKRIKISCLSLKDWTF